jgi:hypothetical protein
LDEILSEMQLTGILGKLNPVLKIKKINFKEREILDEFLKSLTPSERTAFQEMSKGLIAEFKKKKL